MDTARKMDEIRDHIRAILHVHAVTPRVKTLLSIGTQLIDEASNIPALCKPEVSRNLRLQAVERITYLADIAKAISPKRKTIQEPLDALLSDCLLLESALTGATENAER